MTLCVILIEDVGISPKFHRGKNIFETSLLQILVANSLGAGRDRGSTDVCTVFQALPWAPSRSTRRFQVFRR